MRRSAIVNLNTSKFVNALKKNYLAIIFTSIFIVGIVLGALGVARSNTISTFTVNVFSNYISGRKNIGFLKILLSSFFDLLPLSLIIFLCGTSIVGIALTPMAICYKGFTYGILSGFLYKTFLLKGIAFNALLLIPSGLVAAISLIVSGRLAFHFSLLLAKVTIPKGQAVNLYSSFQTYCKQFATTILLIVLSALIDAIMSAAFINFFSF